VGGRGRKKGGKGKGKEGGEGRRDGKGTSVAPQPLKAGDATASYLLSTKLKLPTTS